MSEEPLDPSQARWRALARWDDDGGTVAASMKDISTTIPDMTNAELVQLRVRVIALENMLIAILAEGSDRQLEVAREMARYISPRDGFTAHPLTLHAAHHMNNLVDRAAHFRGVDT